MAIIVETGWDLVPVNLVFIPLEDAVINNTLQSVQLMLPAAAFSLVHFTLRDLQVTDDRMNVNTWWKRCGYDIFPGFLQLNEDRSNAPN